MRLIVFKNKINCEQISICYDPFKCHEINSKIVKQNIKLIAGTFRSVIKSLAKTFDSLRDYMDTTISKSTKCNAMNA